MKPYYEDQKAGITIYCGDCREVLPDIERVDAIWTDPPYLREFLPCYSTLSEHAARLLPEGGSCFAYCGHIFLPEVMGMMAEHLEYWWMLCCEHRGANTIIWSRGVGAHWKPILWYRKPPSKPLGRVINDRVWSKRDKLDHAWGQGREGMLQLEVVTPKGGLILDPFMGAGTTLSMAKSIVSARDWHRTRGEAL